MGTYYRYVNWDLEEYFGLEIGGFNGKLPGAGHTPAARALALLLVEGSGAPDGTEPSGTQPIVGRWHRSRVSLEGEEAPAFVEAAEAGFADVSADVLIMICLFDHDRQLAELLDNDAFYLQVAHLVVTRQLTDGLRLKLETLLGDNHEARYRLLAKDRPHALHSVQLSETLRWFDSGR